MNDTDKNQHLSPILSDITDYGPDHEDVDKPQEPAVEGGDATTAGDPDDSFQALQPRDARNRSSTVILCLTLFLLAALAAALAYQSQTRMDQMQQQISQLRSERPARSAFADEHSHPDNPELAMLKLRVENLQSQVLELHGNSVSEHTNSEPAEIHAPVASAAATPPVSMGDEPGRPQVDTLPPAAPWFVNLASFKLEIVARRWAESLENPPRPVQIVPVDSNGRTFYRVRVGGYATRAEAQAGAGTLKAQWQLDDTWVQLQETIEDHPQSAQEPLRGDEN